MSHKTVKDIMREWLEANRKDYDGLVEEYGECACLTDDLFPCGEDVGNCRIGHKTKCDPELCGEHDWHITAGPRPKPDCYKCVHRRAILRDCHSRCNNIQANIRGNEHGIRHGWFLWPLNYDPTWLEACDGFSDKPEDNLPEANFADAADLIANIDSMSPRQVLEKIVKMRTRIKEENNDA